MIASFVVLLLIAGGMTIFFVTRSDNKSNHKASPTTSASSTPNSPGFPSSTSSSPSSTDTSSSSISEADARKLIEQYVVYINAQDRVHAANLICSDAIDDWRTSIDGKDGDFTVTVQKSTFVSSESTSDGLDVKYDLHVTDIKTKQTGTTTITFTVTEDSGLKLCGEA